MSDARIAFVVTLLVMAYGAGFGFTAGLAKSWDYGWTCRVSGNHDQANALLAGFVWPAALPAVLAFYATAGPGKDCTARGFANPHPTGEPQ